MSEFYGQRPSVLLDIEEPYTAYCLDEACAFISNKLKAGEKPTFKVKYKSFTDMYKKYN